MKFEKSDLNKIKLVIWDLDGTFWEGTLSENDTIIQPVEINIKLVKRLAERGIVNAVCSKNNKAQAEEKLTELGVMDYFVFNSINWEPKGNRINTMISSMALRPANALFLDDNPSNLAEAEYVMPEIMTAGPEAVEILIKAVETMGKDDRGLSRLNQYKVLEKKRNDASAFSSNTDFLKSSGIKICISNELRGGGGYELRNLYNVPIS